MCEKWSETMSKLLHPVERRPDVAIETEIEIEIEIDRLPTATEDVRVSDRCVCTGPCSAQWSRRACELGTTAWGWVDGHTGHTGISPSNQLVDSTYTAVLYRRGSGGKAHQNARR